jgi:glycosyltransferase involved in cell wall biosynthesis
VKILLHSNAPWLPTGYGKQAYLAARILIGQGHEVAFSAFHGLTGQPITWNVPGTGVSCDVYPSGVLPFGADIIVANARLAKADLITSIMDTYMLRPACADLRNCGIPFAPLVVTDSTNANDGPSVLDEQVIKASGALPTGVSMFGVARLHGLGPEGWEPPFVPHAVDTEIYKPPADWQALRAELKTDSEFMIGIMAANRDPMRKGFPEQFEAFAEFSKRHPEARLAVFAVYDSPGGLALDQIAHDFGIIDKTVFMPSFEQVSGLFSDEFCAEWFGSLDILSACSYGEGFCIPALEAQACGTPVVATDCTALTELVRPAGWLVAGHPYWNAAHRGWWKRPDVPSIVKAWEKVYREKAGPRWEERRARAAARAQEYALDRASQHWAEYLKDVQDWQAAHPKEEKP